MTPITLGEMVQWAELDQVYMIPATRGSVHKAMLKIQKIAHELNYGTFEQFQRVQLLEIAAIDKVRCEDCGMKQDDINSEGKD